MILGLRRNISGNILFKFRNTITKSHNFFAKEMLDRRFLVFNKFFKRFHLI